LVADTDTRCIRVVTEGPALRATGPASCELGHRLPATAHGDDGVFAGWSFDGRRLVVETDRYGMYPLFVYADDDEIIVAPSIPALLRAGAPRDLDMDALCVFLNAGFFLDRETPFRSIRALPPGGRLQWTREGVTVEGGRWLTAESGLGRDEAIDAYIELFRAALGRRPPHGRVALPLSGGRDSRHILAELVAAGHAPEVCVTARYFPPRPDEDAAVAAVVAAALDVPHVLLEQGDELETEAAKNTATGFCTDEHAWFSVVAEFLGDGFDTVYDGIGGDVLSAGLYLTPDRLAKQLAGRYLELAEDFLLPRYAATLDRVLAQRLRATLSRERARERVAAELATHAGAANPIGSFCFWNRTRREVALAPYAMGPSSATVYAPYLDHDLYDCLAALPAAALLDRSFHTETIRRAFPEHAGIAFERDTASAVDARAQDRLFIDRLLASRWRPSETGDGLLAPAALRCLRRARLLDRLRREDARLQPRLLLYLRQLGEAADA
jgi:asparagine synthetase B (glutamine-hydrolysing)